MEAVTAAAGVTARLKGYCLPGGDGAARRVRGIHTTQRGEMRSGPRSRWTPFTAEEFVDATASAFRWEARVGRDPVTAVAVTDAYEDGRGRLVVSKGPIKLRTLAGPEVDAGELQRYLAYAGGYCPAMLVNNPALEFTVAGPGTLRVRDRGSPAGVSVEIDVDEDGRPVLMRAVRPASVGKRVIPTPWSAAGSDPRERDGLRVFGRMEASWHPPAGSFTYFRIEVTSFDIVW